MRSPGTLSVGEPTEEAAIVLIRPFKTLHHNVNLTSSHHQTATSYKLHKFEKSAHSCSAKKLLRFRLSSPDLAASFSLNRLRMINRKAQPFLDRLAVSLLRNLNNAA